MYCDFKIVNAKGIAPVSPYQRFEGYHCESTRHYQNLQFNLCEETISRTDEGQPRPKYIFNKCGTNIYFFTLQRFGPSPSPNFKSSPGSRIRHYSFADFISLVRGFLPLHASHIFCNVKSRLYCRIKDKLFFGILLKSV